MTRRAKLAAAFAAYHASVARVCRRILGNAELAHDATQRTFIRLWQRTERDDGPECVQAWLLATASTIARDMARNLAARERAEAAGSARADAAVAPSARPDARACRSELRAALAAAIERLPERQRTIVRSRLHDGLTPAEIAAQLNLTLPTVWTHYARARRRLQAALARFRDQCAGCGGCSGPSGSSIFM